MSVASTGRQEFETLVEQKPLCHPVPFSVRYYGYNHAPGDHLQEIYHTLYKAFTREEHPKDICRIAPRAHGKTEAVTNVFPAWAIVREPSLRVAIVSHKRSVAKQRVTNLIPAVVRIANTLGIEIYDESKTELTLEAGRYNKEPTISHHSIKSDIEGLHFDIVIYDDIATYTNMTTGERGKVIDAFSDHVDNLGDPDTPVPGGPLNVVIGTRKHEDDLYRDQILKRNDHDWDGTVARHEGQPTWDATVYRAMDDWSVIPNQEYVIVGDDGNHYDSLDDLPSDVGIQNNGVIPYSELNVLWPEFKSGNELLYDVIGGESAAVIWKRENMSDPEAGHGLVLGLDSLRFVDSLPKDWDQYYWYAGLDFANPNDREEEMRGDSDYWALSVLAHDKREDVGYYMDVFRKRGLRWKEAATDFLNPFLEPYPVGEVYVESNFAGGSIADTIDKHSDYDIRKSQSIGEKDERLNALGNKIHSGEFYLVGSKDGDRWESFIQDEWLPFPDAKHDDRFDAMEIVHRAVDDALRVLDEDDLSHITFT